MHTLFPFSSLFAGMRRWRFSLLILLGCLLFVSACGETAPLPKVHRPAGVDMALRSRGQLQVETFQQWIGLLRQYGGQIDTYGQELSGDVQALRAAKSDLEYQKAMQMLRQHIEHIQMPALKIEATSQEQQLGQQVAAWGKTHTYRDSYNNTTYRLGFEYGVNGMLGWVRDELSGAKTLADYQQAIKDANTYLTNFQAYRANAADATPWNRPHQADLELMRHYGVAGGKVVVVSFGEQTLRVYDQGRLVRAFRVTTGRPEKPSLPGFWTVEEKLSPTVFKSDEPPGSPYWYPDTPISYAMLYHSGGYFLHDSWWRSDYGPGTQFPHADSSGDSFSFDGSHGCVNLAPANAAWLYGYVEVGMPVIMY